MHPTRRAEVLSRRSDVDRMAFLLKLPDPFQRINADSAFGSSVVLRVVLRVTNDTTANDYLARAPRAGWSSTL